MDAAQIAPGPEREPGWTLRRAERRTGGGRLVTDHGRGNGKRGLAAPPAPSSRPSRGAAVVTFNCGSDPVTIKVPEIKIFNDGGLGDGSVTIDGGGLITLSGGGANRILYQNTCDQSLHSHRRAAICRPPPPGRTSRTSRSPTGAPLATRRRWAAERSTSAEARSGPSTFGSRTVNPEVDLAQRLARAARSTRLNRASRYTSSTAPSTATSPATAGRSAASAPGGRSTTASSRTTTRSPPAVRGAAPSTTMGTATPSASAAQTSRTTSRPPRSAWAPVRSSRWSTI